MSEEKRNVFCHDCGDVTGYDDEGLCSKCHGDNTLSYTDAEARAWAGIGNGPRPDEGTADSSTTGALVINGYRFRL